jgi:PAS domain S-box-containing protein
VVFNQAAEEMLRCSASEVMGQTIDRFIPPAARAAHRRHIPAFGQTGVTNRSMHSLQPLTALRADGDEFPIEATISQVEVGGEKLYTVIMRDITERRRAEEERTQLLTREQAARAEAEAAVLVREAFLSIAAHELKTPLTALLGFTHVLQRSSKTALELPDRDRKALRAIGEQGKRLNRLIEALLDLSRIQLGRLSIEEQAVDVNAMARRVVAELEPTLEQHSLHIQTDDQPCIVLGDELRLEQVLHNLLQNAIKYSPDGGPILVRVVHNHGQIRFSVTDRGIGIPEAAQDFLFLQFYRGSNVDPRQISGLGIGLYVVSQIVSLHGGTIEVVSQEGQGSTFTVVLPPWTAVGTTPGTLSATTNTNNATL